MYTAKSIRKYVQDLGAKKAVPGGGSAAALAGAVGAALLCMVIEFTRGKPQYLRHEKRLGQLAGSLGKARLRLLDYSDEDCEAFARGDRRRALAIPRAAARLGLKVMQACPELAVIGNKNLISDVAVAAVLLEASCSAACYNVGINLASVKSRARRAALSSEIRRIRLSAQKIRRETEVRVGRIIAR
ncbi:MAG: cyclodeaminase/cyclohydrolase family protein [Candidatus Omnitrophica bacterium]|nr:cyclodeaminase/cyclohydrolase family protein [Candidatus Omnitrophota bacterium]